MKRFAHLVVLMSLITLTACNDGVISFPTPEPAQFRVVNTTVNVPTPRVTVDSSSYVDVNRGSVSPLIDVPAGRRVRFGFGSQTRNYLDSVYFTFGSSARVLLFILGDTTGKTTNSNISYLRAIQDTLLPPGTANSFVRFTHIGSATNFIPYEVEVWVNGKAKLTQEFFEAGKSSAQYSQLAPGTYTFQIREYGTTTVLATLPNVELRAGTSYMLYSYDAATPGDLQLGIF